MGKDTMSMSSRLQAGVYHGSAGDYPASMRDLLDERGHVSLNAADYAGYSQENVMRFLADQPYETIAIFSPDGKTAMLDSQWYEDECLMKVYDADKAIKASGGNGEGWTAFHNHPLPKNLKQTDYKGMTPSAKDIEVNATWAGYGPRGGGTYALPTKFAVMDGAGQRFGMEYTGKEKFSPYVWKNEYITNQSRAHNIVQSEYDRLGGNLTSGQMAHIYEREVLIHIRQKAPDYGFRHYVF